jgi:hypothetical protein
MMQNPLISEFLELSSSIKSYLNQEHINQSLLEVSRESYLEYRTWYTTTSKTPVPAPKAIEVQEKNIPQKSSLPPPPANLPKPAPISKPQSYTSVALSKPATPPSEVKPIVEVKPITIEKIEEQSKEDFSDIRKILKEKFPDQVLLDHILDDTEAKSVKNLWKQEKLPPDVLFITGKLNEKQQLFVENICLALKTFKNKKARFLPVKPSEVSEKTQTIELDSIDLYFKEPQRKIELWNRLK